MRHTHLTKGNFTDAEFCPFKFSANNSVFTDLTGAIATDANFTNVDFKNSNLQNIILIGANLTDAKIKQANLQGAQLQGARFTLDQFTDEQILSFHYPDENARFYIKEIFDYMKENDKDKVKHKTGFERAQKLVLSFIHGQNELLTGFLLTGKLPEETGTFSSLFASSESNEKSLRSRLQKVKNDIDALAKANAPPVTVHVPGKG